MSFFDFDDAGFDTKIDELILSIGGHCEWRLPVVPPLPDEVNYGQFVLESLAEVSDQALYNQLGLMAELGEFDQVLCKSLRVCYPLEKAWVNLLDEAGDILYWLTAEEVTGYPNKESLPETAFTHFNRFLITTQKMLEVGNSDTPTIATPLLTYLKQVNYWKLVKRAQDTGSITKL
jgi:hypothetical protein